jgi:hypothetical protein
LEADAEQAKRSAISKAKKLAGTATSRAVKARRSNSIQAAVQPWAADAEAARWGGLFVQNSSG